MMFKRKKKERTLYAWLTRELLSEGVIPFSSSFDEIKEHYGFLPFSENFLTALFEFGIKNVTIPPDIIRDMEEYIIGRKPSELAGPLEARLLLASAGMDRIDLFDNIYKEAHESGVNIIDVAIDQVKMCRILEVSP